MLRRNNYEIKNHKEEIRRWAQEIFFRKPLANRCVRFAATVAGVKNVMDAVKVAKDGGDSLTDEKKAEIQQNMNAMEDAQTGGLSVYTRRADEAEVKAWNK